MSLWPAAGAGSIYRQMKAGTLEHEKGRSLVWVLSQMRAMLEAWSGWSSGLMSYRATRSTSMASQVAIKKLAFRIEELAGAFDPRQVISVAVFDHETEEFAARRHVSLRPEHRGMLVRFDHRREERTGMKPPSSNLGAFACSTATLR